MYKRELSIKDRTHDTHSSETSSFLAIGRDSSSYSKTRFESMSSPTSIIEASLSPIGSARDLTTHSKQQQMQQQEQHKAAAASIHSIHAYANASVSIPPTRPGPKKPIILKSRSNDESEKDRSESIRCVRMLPQY